MLSEFIAKYGESQWPTVMAVGSAPETELSDDDRRKRGERTAWVLVRVEATTRAQRQ